MALISKRKRFAEEYVVDLNATQAAIRAGYSEKTAYSQGHRLLMNDEVKEYIRQLQKEVQERTQITRDRIVNEAAKIAFGNISDVVEWSNGSIDIIPSSKLDEDTKARISEISCSVVGGTKIKQYDKIRALDLLAKILGLYDDGKDKGEAPEIKVDLP